MTIQQVTTQIRQYGMVATWQANYEEWRVNYRRDDSRYNGINTVYYTSDVQDAIDTAKAMSEYKKI